MRVVFLTHNYPRHPGDLAGAFLHPLARALAGLGHDVRVVAPSDRGRGGRDRLDGVPVRRVRYATPGTERFAYTGTLQTALRSPAGLVALIGLWRALRAGAREEARDAPAGGVVVHAHWWIPAAWAAPPELPLVVSVHGTDARLLAGSRAARFAARAVFRRSAVVAAVSTAAAALIRPLVPWGRPVPVQPMAMDPTAWPAPVPPPRLRGRRLLVVSRLTAQKRVALALEARALLQADTNPPELVVVGDGPERPALERLARDRGLAGGVRFTGQLGPEGVRAQLGEAGVALQLSRGEGFGLAAVEALVSGVPVIACEDGGGLLDIVPPAGAGRVVPADPQAIAAAVRDLLAAPEAGDQARALGAAWRQRLAPETVARRFAGWYEEAARA